MNTSGWTPLPVMLTLICAAIVVAGLWTSACPCPSRPAAGGAVLQPAPPEPPRLDLSPRADIDEQLYMLRRLENLSYEAPLSLQSGEEASRQLAALRHEIQRGEQHAAARGMNPRLLALHADVVELIDQLVELLADVGYIEREFHTRSLQQAAEAEGKAFDEGFAVGGGLAATKAHPYAAALVVGSLVLKNLIEDNVRRQQLDNEKAAVHERRLRRYQAEESQLRARVEANRRALIEEQGWTASDLAIQPDLKQLGELQTAVANGDLLSLLSISKPLAAARPRDPFLWEASGMLQQSLATLFEETEEGAGELHRLAVDDLLTAVRLIPAGRHYDEHRTSLLLAAANSETQLIFHGAPHGERALALLDAVVAYELPSNLFYAQFIRALACARLGRREEALACLEKCKPIPEEPECLETVACVLSLAGREGLGFESLKLAWAHGNRDVRRLRKMPDLQPLREQFAKEFSQLVTPQWQWRISYGFLWNDVRVENRSEFPLTEALVKVVWKGKNGAEWREVYWAAEIPEGGQCQFQGALDKATHAQVDAQRTTVQIHCQETRSVARIGAAHVARTFNGIATLMAQDGSDVGATGRLRLQIAPKADDSLVVSVAVDGVSLTLVADPPFDSCAVATSAAGGPEQMRLYFDGNAVYGWLQIGDDAEAGKLRAFIAE